MYSIRNAGRYATRTQYVLGMLPILWRELRKVRWIKCMSLGFMIGVYGIAIPCDAFKPKPIVIINEAHAEEVKEVPVLIEVRIDWTKERIDQEIEKKAAEYGKSAARLKKIVKCESGYDTDVQSQHMLSYGQEKSFGLAQIHLPDHPSVSYEEAIDPAFAIDFLAKNVDRVKWSCDR